MSCGLFRWIWLLKSPLHIGASPAGALNRTRLYVPAPTLLGALIAQLARHRVREKDLPDYRAYEKFFKEETRLSYLFPAEKPQGSSWQAWLPRYWQRESRCHQQEKVELSKQREEAGLIWQREEDGNCLQDRHFRMRLLISQQSTAIDPETDTAAEGSLREWELISAWWKDPEGERRRVAMVGYILCRNQEKCREILSTLKEIKTIFVGGETRYGFGWMTLEDYEPTSDLFGFQVSWEGIPLIRGVDRLLAHTYFAPESIPRGAKECFRWWDARGVRPGLLAWVPGSTLTEARNVIIRSNGLWKVV